MADQDALPPPLADGPSEEEGRQQLLTAVVKVQALWRGKQQRTVFKGQLADHRKQKAIIAIQCACRVFLAKKEFEKALVKKRFDEIAAASAANAPKLQHATAGRPRPGGGRRPPTRGHRAPGATEETSAAASSDSISTDGDGTPAEPEKPKVRAVRTESGAAVLLFDPSAVQLKRRTISATTPVKSSSESEVPDFSKVQLKRQSVTVDSSTLPEDREAASPSPAFARVQLRKTSSATDSLPDTPAPTPEPAPFSPFQLRKTSSPMLPTFQAHSQPQLDGGSSPSRPKPANFGGVSPPTPPPKFSVTPASPRTAPPGTPPPPASLPPPPLTPPVLSLSAGNLPPPISPPPSPMAGSASDLPAPIGEIPIKKLKKSSKEKKSKHTKMMSLPPILPGSLPPPVAVSLPPPMSPGLPPPLSPGLPPPLSPGLPPPLSPGLRPPPPVMPALPKTTKRSSSKSLSSKKVKGGAAAAAAAPGLPPPIAPSSPTASKAANKKKKVKKALDMHLRIRPDRDELVTKGILDSTAYQDAAPVSDVLTSAKKTKKK